MRVVASVAAISVLTLIGLSACHAGEHHSLDVRIQHVPWFPGGSSAQIIQVPEEMGALDDEPMRDSPSTRNRRGWLTQEQERVKAVGEEAVCAPVHVYGDVSYWHPASGCHR